MEKTIKLVLVSHKLENFFEAIGYTEEDVEDIEVLLAKIRDESETLSQVLETVIGTLEGKKLLLALLLFGKHLAYEKAIMDLVSRRY